MRARGLFLCPPKNTPTPSATRRGGERPRGGKHPGHCVTTAPTPTPQPQPATGQGQGTTGAQGHAWGARTAQVDKATRRTFTTASDSEHSSISAKQQSKSSSRETNSNGIEHSTLRRRHTELSGTATQREEPSTLQATANTTRRRKHNGEATRQRNAKNTQHQQHDATRM